MSREVFEPKWPDEPNENGVYLPKDLDFRTPHPSSPPKAICDIISSTYHRPSPKPKNEDATFTPFPRLAIELRRIIWELSLPGKRTVEVLFDKCTGQCRSSCPIPTALHVNSEARGIALEYYELAFGTARAEASIYFNFKIDTLFLGAGNFSPSIVSPVPCFFRVLQQKDLERIEHVMVEDYVCPFKQILCDFEADESTDSDIEDGSNDHVDNADSEVETSSVNSEFAWENKPDNRLCLGLSNLQTLTIISHVNDCDIVFQETEHNPGEFHLWYIGPDGRRLPLRLRDEMDSSMFQLTKFPALWRRLEEAKWAGEIKLSVLRIVARERFEKDEEMQKRAHFLQQVVFPGGYNYCLYPADGVIDRAMEMQENQPELYDDLHDYLGIDPEYLYISHTRCVCPVGHRHQPVYNVDEPDILKHQNLQEGLQAFFDMQENLEEDHVPGGYSNEDSNNEDIGCSLPISPGHVIATSTAHQSFDTELTAADLNGSAPLQDEFLTQEHEDEPRLPLVQTSRLCQLADLLNRFLPSRFLGILIAINEVLSLGGLIYGLLVLDIKDLWGPVLGFGVCLFINRLRSLTRPSADQSPDFLALIFHLVRGACMLVVEDLKKDISYIKAATTPLVNMTPSGQTSSGNASSGNTPSGNTPSANTSSVNTSSGKTPSPIRRRINHAFLVFTTVSIWVLLILIGVALVFTLMRLLVEIMSVLVLFVAALWLLGLWLRVVEEQNK